MIKDMLEKINIRDKALIDIAFSVYYDERHNSYTINREELKDILKSVDIRLESIECDREIRVRELF